MKKRNFCEALADVIDSIDGLPPLKIENCEFENGVIREADGTVLTAASARRRAARLLRMAAVSGED